MADTMVRTCHSCEEETDCVLMGKYWKCQECYLEGEDKSLPKGLFRETNQTVNTFFSQVDDFIKKQRYFDTDCTDEFGRSYIVERNI